MLTIYRHTRTKYPLADSRNHDDFVNTVNEYFGDVFNICDKCKLFDCYNSQMNASSVLTKEGEQHKLTKSIQCAPGCILNAFKPETTFQIHRNQRTTLEKSKQIIIQTCFHIFSHTLCFFALRLFLLNTWLIIEHATIFHTLKINVEQMNYDGIHLDESNKRMK